VAQRLRADNKRIAERIEHAEPLRPSAAAPAAAPASVNESIESARAAVAAAILPQGEEVMIRPLAPKPSLFIDPPAGGAEVHEPMNFIPPPAERLPRAPRMPRIDELPVPAQNEIRARRGELAQEGHPEKQRMSLLKRLASVGLGRREADHEPAHEEPEVQPSPRGAPMAAPRSSERLPGRPLPPRAEPRPEPVSEYAKRSSPQGLDQHGRQASVHSHGEDQLDIPAFLRRQAN
jgi:cell division protein FtsZ